MSGPLGSGQTTAAPIVVGLDLSLTATGVAYGDGSTTTLAAPEAKRKKGEHRTLDLDLARLVWLRDEIFDACLAPLTGRTADLVVVEDYAFSRGDSHAHGLGELGGIVRVAFLERAVPFVLVGPTALKMYATGRGNATKPDMRTERLKRTGVDERDPDQNDAWWLRAMGLHALGHPVLPLPATHTRGLDSVDWRGHRASEAA